MRELRCEPPGGRPTRVRIGAPVLASMDSLLDEHFGGRRRFVVGDQGALAAFATPAPRVDHSLPGGESLKSFGELERLLDAIGTTGLDRSGGIVALGGGAVGDLTGLAASLWLRGVELVMVPTTLLSMVDSSVGGKTAIDVRFGKNLVGAYWPASIVWIDTGFLATLPEEQYRSGLGEVLKVAIGLDAELFELCERARAGILARDPLVLEQVVALSLRAKIRVVESDPREEGPRRLLNLGHTLGHALEAQAGFALPHGIAVARGVHHALDLAERTGTIPAADAGLARSLLESYGFHADSIPPPEQLLRFVSADKKMVGATLHVVLPDGVGSSRIESMSPVEFLGQEA